MKKINILRIFFIAILAFIAIGAFLKSERIETNLLRAFFSDNAKDELLVELSGKYSSNINVLIESSNPDLIEKAKEEFVKNIDKKSFEIKSANFVKTLEFYKKYQNNLLSYNDYKTMKNGDFEAITQQAVDNLYNPFGFSLLPEEEDPFLLFTGYITSLGDGGVINSVNGKYYEIINLEVEKELALSPSLTNKEVKKLIDLQHSQCNDNIKIYLTGAPVHSYYASAKSMNEINIICIISALFVGGLVLWYFRSLKILLPIMFSLATGMGMGYCVCALLFSSIHILTFVFSTTLIGICVDYSLHYLMESDIKKVIKSLTVSMLTTVSSLLILLFSGIELLKQIAVFTSTGLITVYCLVVLFYSFLPPQTSKHKFDLKFNKKLLIVFGLIILAGLFRIHFNDDIRTMYKPSKQMIEAEKLYQEVTSANSNTSFVIVEGNNLQDILEREENIAQMLNDESIAYYSLSKFLPSIKRQKENMLLRTELYESELNVFSELLTPENLYQIKHFDKKYFSEEAFKNINRLNEFMLDKTHSIMVVYDVDNPEFLEGVENTHYINLPSEISGGIKKIRLACLKILVPIYILLYLLLGFIFTFKNAVKIICPSILASLFAISFISLLQPLNLFHILAIFLITGFGLDYAIFRFNGSKNSNDAVLISCITTVFSFLLLAFTSFKLISSLGFMLALGLASSYILSILLISKDSPLKTDNINSGSNLTVQ